MTKDWSQRCIVDDWIEDERILQMSQAELEVELARQGDSFRSAVARAKASVLLAKDKAANMHPHIQNDSPFCVNDPRVICPGGAECCEDDDE